MPLLYLMILNHHSASLWFNSLALLNIHTVQRKMVVGENIGKFSESVAICQSFPHPNLYHKMQVDSMTND